MPASQAGRRGFEPRLPLHFLSNLADFTSSRFTSVTSKTRFDCGIGSSSLCRLAANQSKLQLGYRFLSAFKIALGVRIDSDPDRVPTLVGGHFRVDALLMAKTRLGPAQYLKVHPPESDLFELLLNVPPQKIVTRQIRAAFGRKHQCIRTCIRRDVAPIINLAGKIWRQRRLPLAALGLWVVQKTPVNALSDLDHL